MALFNSLFPNQNPNSTTPPPENLGGLTSSAVDPIKQSDISAISKLDPRANVVFSKAHDEALSLHAVAIEPREILLGLISDRDIFNLLNEFGVDPAKLTREIQSMAVAGNSTTDPLLSDATKQVLESAYSNAKNRGVDFVTPEDILISLMDQNISAIATLKASGVDRAKIETKLSSNTSFQTGKKSVLAQFGVDLTQKARDGKLDPVTGRDKESERLVHILMRRTKNNPIIIGEAGVGKTAIVEGLAELIAAGKVAPDLAKRKIIQLDVSNLIAGASHRGEFEERLQNVVKEAMASNGEIILFIDEIHTLIGAGDTDGSLDASNIIKPYLSRGQLQIIGTTTTAEYRRNFEKDRAFERRFQPIVCEEPSEEVAMDMIKILQNKYENFHKITYSPEAMKAAVHLSKRYIGERFLPDKAIDLLDEAGSQVRLEIAKGSRKESVVTEADIQRVVSDWTGVPITKLTEKESDKLIKLEQFIHEKFINHDRAVTAVAEAVRRGRIGLANASRPIASFIFLGPTGTGKTELAKVLAEIMFGRKDAMIRLDMSEYMEKHEVAKLLGAPPGYVGYEEGGQLTEAVRSKPYSIVLLDEIEKAHPDVFNILLQLLDDGRLTDNKGVTVSFKNTIIICTSNIGSQLIREKLQSGPKVESAPAEPVSEHDETIKNVLNALTTATQTTPNINSSATAAGLTVGGDKFKELNKMVLDELNKFFKPELINRFDEVVVFEPLSQENMMLISKLALDATKGMLKDQNVGLEISDKALAQLAKDGYDPAYGARPLRRLVQREIENPIAVFLITKSVGVGETIVADYDSTKDKFVFGKKPTPKTVESSGGTTEQVPTATTNLGAPTVQATTPLSGTQPAPIIEDVKPFSLGLDNAKPDAPVSPPAESVAE